MIRHRTAVKKAGLDQADKPRLRFHDLRHTYASLLIAQGVNVAFVSRHLGRASITTTLNVYAHLFDHAEHAASVIGRLEDSFGTSWGAPKAEPPNPAHGEDRQLPVLSSQRPPRSLCGAQRLAQPTCDGRRKPGGTTKISSPRMTCELHAFAGGARKTSRWRPMIPPPVSAAVNQPWPGALQ